MAVGIVQSVTFKWNDKTKRRLQEFPDKVVKEVAIKTLDLTYPIIPKDTHTMAQETKAFGVRGTNKNYYLSSPTDYASYVYTMPSGTRWSEPGTTSQWFQKTWKRHGNNLINQVVERNKL